MENVPQILPNTRTFTAAVHASARSSARVVLLDRRQPLEVALHAGGELVALGLQQPQLRLLRARARFWRAREPARSESRGHSAAQHDDRRREQGDEEPAHAVILVSRAESRSERGRLPWSRADRRPCCSLRPTTMTQVGHGCSRLRAQSRPCR